MEVTTVVNQARATMGTDPDKALANLRDESEKIRQLPELRPELRDQLLGQLQAAIRAGKARKTEHENHMRQIQEAEAAAKERMFVADSHEPGPAEGQAVDGPLRGAHPRRQVQGGRRGRGGRGGQDRRQPHGPDQ